MDILKTLKNVFGEKIIISRNITDKLLILFKENNIEEPEALVEEHLRQCDNCKAIMDKGYLINGGDEYYCSDYCLHKHYTKEEWKEMYSDDGDSYYTDWGLDDLIGWESFERVLSSNDKTIYAIKIGSWLRVNNIENYIVKGTMEKDRDCQDQILIKLEDRSLQIPTVTCLTRDGFEVIEDDRAFVFGDEVYATTQEALKLKIASALIVSMDKIRIKISKLEGELEDLSKAKDKWFEDGGKNDKTYCKKIYE